MHSNGYAPWRCRFINRGRIDQQNKSGNNQEVSSAKAGIQCAVVSRPSVGQQTVHGPCRPLDRFPAIPSCCADTPVFVGMTGLVALDSGWVLSADCVNCQACLPKRNAAYHRAIYDMPATGSQKPKPTPTPPPLLPPPAPTPIPKMVEVPPSDCPCGHR